MSIWLNRSLRLGPEGEATLPQDAGSSAVTQTLVQRVWRSGPRRQCLRGAGHRQEQPHRRIPTRTSVMKKRSVTPPRSRITLGG